MIYDVKHHLYTISHDGILVFLSNSQTPPSSHLGSSQNAGPGPGSGLGSGAGPGPGLGSWPGSGSGSGSGCLFFPIFFCFNF